MDSLMNDWYRKATDGAEDFLTKGDSQIGQEIMEKFRSVHEERNALYRQDGEWTLHPSQGLIEARRIKVPMGEHEPLLGPQPDGLSLVEIVVRRADTAPNAVGIALDHHNLMRAVMTEQDWMTCLLNSGRHEPYPVTFKAVEGRLAERYRPEKDHTSQKLKGMGDSVIDTANSLLQMADENWSEIDDQITRAEVKTKADRAALAKKIENHSNFISMTVTEVAKHAEQVSVYSRQIGQEVESYLNE